MPPKRAAAKRARSPEPDQQSTTQQPIIEPRSSDSSSSALSLEVAALLAKFPRRPLKALWEALADPSNKGPELAMAIVAHKSCGLERKSVKQDGPMTALKDYWSLQKGATPILMAAYANRLDVVASLAAAGANVLAKTETEDTILHGAAKNQNPELVQLALGFGIEVNAANKLGETALHCAVLHAPTIMLTGRLATVELLITNGADVMAVSPSYGYTPLVCAIQNDDVDCMKLLIAKGADVKVLAKCGHTLLHLAANNGGRPLATELLISNGANVNAKDDFGVTPLHIASSTGSVSVVKQLIDANAEVNVIDSFGCTPLSNAQSHPEIVALLLATGAS
eukprot:GILI01007229.1.p1 GENE.GILI01007229.1~~GILI01007229.1.p1  ORF type:complete len:348 (-),score=50.27 GILI01007229.1:180-1193(-)